MKNTKKAIASLLVVLMLLSAIMFTLASCRTEGNNNNNNNNGNQGGEGNEGNGETQNTTYNITLTTKGGMVFAETPVYIYEYVDGALGELIDYVATDAEGKASISLPSGSQYAVNFGNGIPDGYDDLPFYPLVSSDMKIELTSSLLPDEGLTGLTYILGSVMHDFSVTTTTGEVLTLSKLLEEKEAVLLNFWFSTCSPCLTEFPLMQGAYEKYQDKIAIIALNPPDTQAQDTLDTIRQFKAQNGLTFDVAQDLDGIKNTFGVNAYPTSVMIDRYGVVTMIETGSITSEVVFDQIFDYFTKDNYEQKLIYNYEDIVPKIKPNVEMPSSEEISSVFDKGMIPGIQYIPYRESASDDEKEFSWPFVIDTVELSGAEYKVLKTSNAKIEASFCQMLFNIELKAGEVLAFDYYASTELGADMLYVVVDGKDTYSISGQSTEWQTCYSFVAPEDATYEVGFVYQKDYSTNYELDTVFLKDLRVVEEKDIDSATYIYRFAVTKPDEYGAYTDYVDVVLGDDGYYHVGTKTGPILLADLMGFTRFSDEYSVYELAGQLLTDGFFTEAEYDLVIQYCNYASNSQINGSCSVTKELAELLSKIAGRLGVQDNDKDWLRFCFYYNAYGTDGKEFEDPIKGLALFSAQDVILSDKGATDFPNSFVYNRIIMPRGYLAKFTPEVSGTYLITSNAPDPNNEGHGLETNAWIFTANYFGQREAWYTYENVDRFNTSDVNNCYMIAYFEEGKDYYIDIAFYDVYQEGTINFRVERLGDEGFYRFSLASPGYFTTLENPGGEMASWFVHGGIDVVLGDDGIWREKRTDGRTGSIMYADFTMKTPIFSHSLADMIDRGAFNFGLSEEDQYILNHLKMNDNDPDKCREQLRTIWGEDYDTYAEIYKVEEVFQGITHADGKDYTETMRGYLDMIIKVGYNEQLGETIKEGDERIGCVVVTAELAEILQLLMDKYTFMNGSGDNTWSVENSWTKVCYYSQYFCAATPN